MSTFSTRRLALARNALTIALGSLALPVAALCWATPAAAATRFTLPNALLDGYSRTFKLDVALRIHLAVELEPRDGAGLTALAASGATAPAGTPRTRLGEAQFLQRFARPAADARAVAGMLRAHGAGNVYESRNHLVIGGDLTVRQAEEALHTRYDLWQRGDRTIVAPTTPLTLPVGGVRAVRGAIKAFTPRLAAVQRPGLPTDLRGAWYDAARFREAYDALPEGGAGMRIALIEDSSDRADPKDFDATAHVAETLVTAPISEQICGRDDRGQEATMDVAAAAALAPQATLDVRYDEVCVRGGEGAAELERALEADPAPDVIVFPFAVAPLYGPVVDAFGPPPLAYLEAAVRGIAIVVPSGDDGAYGIRAAGVETAAVVYPCVLPYVICAGGTQLGERNGQFDEGPWNDGTHATGGGISQEIRPAWQQAPMDFALAHSVDRRMVPDVAADASGHLAIHWHGYATGGVGGTSEAAAIVGAQLAAIDAAVPRDRRILGPADLYALASAHPEAFREVSAANDRGYRDNTMHPAPPPLPLGYRGVVPSPPPAIRGCAPVRPEGCDVASGYNPVTGLGSLKERVAAAALSQAR